MKKCISITWLIFTSILSYAQQEDISLQNDSLLQEGKTLYLTEMASWYGTDIFLEAVKDRDNIGGYFSYPTGNAATCIFYSREEKPRVIGTMTFDSTFSTSSATADLTQRDFSASEYELFQLRAKAFEITKTDSFFARYENTGVNIIPIIYKGIRKVYILTGPKKNGIVIFGNDYLITFDDQKEVIAKKRLHRNIITVDYGKKMDDGNKVVGAVHSHLPETGDLLTVTDICTLMLYQKFAGWEQHTVISENYLSIWNCKSNTLVSITKHAMDKIYKDKKKSKKED